MKLLIHKQWQQSGNFAEVNEMINSRQRTVYFNLVKEDRQKRRLAKVLAQDPAVFCFAQNNHGFVKVKLAMELVNVEKKFSAHL